MRVATIDIGTNSILLLVVETDAEGTPKVILDRCRIERLGKGVDRTGLLDEQAVSQSLAALKEYAALIRRERVEKVAAIGTQALREARNGADFLGPAAEILGAPVLVIDGEREAELAFLAVLRSFPALNQGGLVVCDIGGGSTELISGESGVISACVSLPIGAVRLAERFLVADPPPNGQVNAMIACIENELTLGASWARAQILVGTAGTVTTLAAVSLGLEPYVPERVQGMHLARAEIERQLEQYLGMSSSSRRTIRGLAPERADVIPAGAAIASCIMRHVGSEEIIVSDRGIRWGLAFELLAACGA